MRLPLVVRFALREMRGGLRGFYVFIACIALGTGTIAAVNSLASGLGDSIRAEGQALLGGDIAFSLIHRRASEDELSFLEKAGRLTTVATLRAMARPPDGRQTLVEVKGVDDAYPLYGDLELRSGRPLAADFADAGEVIPVVVDASLLTTAGLSIGDEFGLGRLTVRVADVITREPDKLSGGIAFGPRVLMPIEALDASGLVATGSLVRWGYRIAGTDRPMSEAEIEATIAAAREAFPTAGWRIETRNEAAPQLRRSIDSFAQFLTLVGLTSLAVGGVGVANAVRAYLARKRTSIATFRSLGASRGFVVRLYLVQIMMLASIGVVAGLLLGAVGPPIAAFALRDFLPVSALFSIFPADLLLAAVYGLLTAVTFALWPLGRAYAIRPSALFRDDPAPVAGGGRIFLALTSVSAALLCGLAIAAAYDPLLALFYVLGAGAVFVVLRVIAGAIMAAARQLPRSRSVVVRLAVANIHRRGALTPTVTLSLGLSLTLLVTLALVDGNLRHTLTSSLPAEAPSFFFIDIQNEELDGFLQLLNDVAQGGDVRSQPMLRGRIVAINGVAAEDWPETEASWVLRGDRGITYAAELPADSRLVAGRWWPPEGAEGNEVSFAAGLAEELGVGVGDRLRVNVLGREVEATITNLRTVDWETLSINFVMVFSPNVFAGAPHAHLATLTFPEGGEDALELAVLKRVSEAYPTVTSIRVKEALEAVNGVISDLALAVRAAAGVTLLSAMLVLAGTLAASHRSRIYDAVILKTLGARRRVLLEAYSLEYALLGLASAVFGVLAGTAGAVAITVGLMDLSFVFLPVSAIGAVVVAVVVTVGLGLVGTWRALNEAPAAVLRDL
ncbi:FtsX-like permease family protein [Acuticoccus sp. 2012]|uniref:FtsX-like permease family protein n=2 Tax=Acuticoccus mangrovi TaxID=2796142 RepID=A0A934IJN3_9HYPH|nr:FtsX-like permease family protein [Acuticoccus mangrovi]MBJ3777919.1 FtsX-like permease family protein [Acuticoccus mangrovi]